MTQRKVNLQIKMSLSIHSDDDGFYYLDPFPGNIESLIRRKLSPFIQTKSMEIHSLEVTPMTSLSDES